MTHEVVKSQPSELTQEDILIQVLQTQKELKQNQEVLAGDVDYLKNEQPVNPSICLELENLRKVKVIKALGGKDSQAYKDRSFAGKVFRQAAKDFKEFFRIPRYDLLKKKDEEKAFTYWESWEPSHNTKMEIKKSPSLLKADEVGADQKMAPMPLTEEAVVVTMQLSPQVLVEEAIAQAQLIRAMSGLTTLITILTSTHKLHQA